MKLYLVLFNWATDDDSGLDTKLYSTYEAAVNAFNNIVKDELNPELSWVGGVFDKNGNYDEDLYELNCSNEYDGGEECELWWCINDLNGCAFCDIHLKIIGVDEHENA